MKRAVFAFVLASVLVPQAAADARFQPEPPFTLAHGGSYGNAFMVADTTGGTIVAWVGLVAGVRLFVQHFGASGVPRAEAAAVLKSDPPFVYLSVVGVTVDRDGRFAVTYTRETDWPDVGGMAGFCLFEADDTLVRCQDTPVSEAIGSAALAFEPAGRFMLGWRSYGSSVLHLFARIYARDGTPSTPAFEIDQGGVSSGPFLTPAGPGAFRLAWSRASALRVQRYDTSGAALDEPVELAVEPACAGDQGAFVSVWKGMDAQGAGAVFARMYDTAGQARGATLQANEWPGNATALHTACDAAGDFVVAWAAPTGSGQQVFARRFTAAGVADGAQFRVDRGTPFNASTPPLVALTSQRDGNFNVILEGSTSAAPDVAQPYRVQPTPRVKGDFDGDGHADLVLRRADDGSVRVWCLHEGVRMANMPLWPTSPDPDWQIEGVADFDADGHADLLVRQPLTGDVRVWLLGGASGVEVLGQAMLTGAPLPGVSWEIAATADFDRDGKADLLWRDNATQQLAVWLLDGMAWRATLVPDPDHAVDANWKVVAAGDMNGDGWSDLLWYNTSSGRVVQWLLDATLTRTTGRFTEPAQAGDANWQVVAAADYGFGVRAQAGTYDILWRNATTGNLVAWFMDNAGQRTAGTFLTPSAPSDPLAWTVVGPR